jgi:multidrug efflux pump subunit AcrB
LIWEGVHEVNLYGAGNYCLELKYDPLKIAYYHLNPQDLSNAVFAFNKIYDLGRGYVADPEERGGTRYNYLTLKSGPSSALTDWGKILVRRNNGRDIFLTDIARVSYALQPEESYYRINGLNTVNMEIVAGKNTKLYPPCRANKIENRGADERVASGIYAAKKIMTVLVF